MSHKADTEKVDNRPKCDWPVDLRPPNSTEPAVTKPCGSEERIYQVSTPAKDGWGNPMTNERNVCQKHLGDAWQSAVPDTEAHQIDVPAGKR